MDEQDNRSEDDPIEPAEIIYNIDIPQREWPSGSSESQDMGWNPWRGNVFVIDTTDWKDGPGAIVDIPGEEELVRPFKGE